MTLEGTSLDTKDSVTWPVSITNMRKYFWNGKCSWRGSSSKCNETVLMMILDVVHLIDLQNCGHHRLWLVQVGPLQRNGWRDELINGGFSFAGRQHLILWLRWVSCRVSWNVLVMWSLASHFYFIVRLFISVAQWCEKQGHLARWASTSSDRVGQ